MIDRMIERRRVVARRSLATLIDATRHALRSHEERPMLYHIAGIDLHKKMLAVAVADVEVGGDSHFQRLKVGTSPVQLRALADWLVERDVDEVVMESTAQYWRPVWEALARYWRSTRRMRTDARLYPARSTLHKRSRIGEPSGGRETFRMRNVW